MNFEPARANTLIRVEKTDNGVRIVTAWDSTALTRVQARALAGTIRSQMRVSDKINVQCAVTEERVFKWSGGIRAASDFANELIRHAGPAHTHKGDE